MAAKLYQGRVSLVDTETQERIHVAVMVAMDDDHISCTIRPTDGSGLPRTVQLETVRDGQGVARILSEMIEVSSPREKMPDPAPPANRAH